MLYGCQVDGCIFANGSVRAAPGFNGHDAFCLQYAADDGADALVFLGVDVAGDGNQITELAAGGAAAAAQWNREPPRPAAAQGTRRLTLRLHWPADEGERYEWLVVMREISEKVVLSALADTVALTAREAEVLHWAVRGKVNRDIGDIVGASSAIAKKNIQRIFTPK